jgi:hypothetical protein
MTVGWRDPHCSAQPACYSTPGMAVKMRVPGTIIAAVLRSSQSVYAAKGWVDKPDQDEGTQIKHKSGSN